MFTSRVNTATSFQRRCKRKRSRSALSRMVALSIRNVKIPSRSTSTLTRRSARGKRYSPTPTSRKATIVTIVFNFANTTKEKSEQNARLRKLKSAFSGISCFADGVEQERRLAASRPKISVLISMQPKMISRNFLRINQETIGRRMNSKKFLAK